MNNKVKRSVPKSVVTFSWVAALMLIWEVLAIMLKGSSRRPEYVLPQMSQIIGSFFDSAEVMPGQTAFQVVLSNAAITLMRAGTGFLIGMTAGFALSLIMSLSKVTEKIAFPYLMMIQMIPILGMAPIVFALTGDIDKSRIVIAAILTFYPVATNTLAGFKSVERQKHELMHSYAANKWVVYTKTMIPASVPYFFTGLKIAAPMAITASILVDTLQGDGGLGCMLSQSLKHAISIYVFWEIVFFSAALGIVGFYLMGLFERFISPISRSKNAARRKSRLRSYFSAKKAESLALSKRAEV